MGDRIAEKQDRPSLIKAKNVKNHIVAHIWKKPVIFQNLDFFLKEGIMFKNICFKPIPSVVSWKKNNEATKNVVLPMWPVRGGDKVEGWFKKYLCGLET